MPRWGGRRGGGRLEEGWAGASCEASPAPAQLPSSQCAMAGHAVTFHFHLPGHLHLPPSDSAAMLLQ